MGFIGGGRITKIFLQALKNKDYPLHNIIVSDLNSILLESLKNDFPEIEITNDNKKPASTNIIFLAVHPPVIAKVLEEISTIIKHESILISLAPKFTIENFSAGLKSNTKIVRMIPNAPSIINQGYNPVTYSKSIKTKDRKLLNNLFKKFGDYLFVEETKLEGYALMTGMLPTYFWFQFYELLEIGKSLGFAEAELQKSFTKTIPATLNTMFKSDLTASQVMDLVPVKPIGEQEQTIKEMYRNKLNEIYNKIKP